MAICQERPPLPWQLTSTSATNPRMASRPKVVGTVVCGSGLAAWTVTCAPCGPCHSCIPGLPASRLCVTGQTLTLSEQGHRERLCVVWEVFLHGSLVPWGQPQSAACTQPESGPGQAAHRLCEARQGADLKSHRSSMTRSPVPLSWSGWHSGVGMSGRQSYQGPFFSDEGKEEALLAKWR